MTFAAPFRPGAMALPADTLSGGHARGGEAEGRSVGPGQKGHHQRRRLGRISMTARLEYSLPVQTRA